MGIFVVRLPPGDKYSTPMKKLLSILTALAFLLVLAPLSGKSFTESKSEKKFVKFVIQKMPNIISYLIQLIFIW